MYFKLSFRNIKRSFKDYSIYFLTLIFSVSLFYISNSIESQKVMLDLSGSYTRAFDMVSEIMNITSIFIAVIMAFLIIYANNYLYKRRKKELGIYMLLGMEKINISKILYLEGMLIGIISLGIGLIVGILGSHLLSLFTASLFEVSLTEFTFVFSKDAFIKTIISFAVIYIVIAIFNSGSIKKVKLIKLLNANKQNESVKVKNHKASILIFIISILCIGYAYYNVLDQGLMVLDGNILLYIALGTIGTFLLFMSLSGFLLKVFQSNRNFYFKDVNMFVLRQISSKINTVFISMTFICLMLFVSICSLSGGILINRVLNKNVIDLSHYDITAYNYDGTDFENHIKTKFDLDKYASDYHYYTVYNTDMHYSDFLTKESLNSNIKNQYHIAIDANIPVMKLSDFNKELSMIGKDTVNLDKNQYIINSNINEMNSALEEVIKANKEVTISNKKLTPKSDIIDASFYNGIMKNTTCTLVVNDELVDNLPSFNTFFNINLKKGVSLDEASTDLKNIKENKLFNSINKEEVTSGSKGIGISIAYMALYLGITFIIAAAAVLAIQQLSESDDNVERYNLLRKIGVDESVINKTLFNQIGIYFMLPLIIAIIHSVVGIKLSKAIVNTFGCGASISDFIIISSLFIVVVYGGYFMATYLGAKNIIKKKQ